MVEIPLRKHVEAWAPGRNPLGRAVLLAVFLFILWRHLRDPLYSSIVDGLNLVIHESGHLAFAYFGEWLGVAGGTLFQLGIPVLVGVMFYRQSDFFALAVALFWIGTNLVDVGVYAADARARSLDLVSPTAAHPLHDWNYLLGRAGLLAHDRLVGSLFRVAGILVMASAILWGGWMVKLMWYGRRSPAA